MDSSELLGAGGEGGINAFGGRGVSGGDEVEGEVVRVGGTWGEVEAGSSGIVITPISELDIVAGRVGTVTCVTVEPFSPTTSTTVETMTEGADGCTWRPSK